MADIRFYFEPTCPVSWRASTWVRRVAAERGQTVDWRFLALRVLNTGINYDQEFAPGVEHVHNAGIRMLRVAVQVRAEKGNDGVDRFYRSAGEYIFETRHPSAGVANAALDARPDHVEMILAAAGLPRFYAEVLNDPSLEDEIIKESVEALELIGLTAAEGRTVGAPVIQPVPHGPAFAGPVLKSRPSDAEAAAIADTLLTLAGFPGYAEFDGAKPEQS
jgi:hypothetical protein